MNTKKANLINSISLILIGFWGFIDVSSITALIPSIFGVLIFICYFLSRKNQKLNLIFAHIAVLLTILILIALIGTRLPKSLDEGGLGLIIMISTCSFALIVFIKSFIESRKS